MADRNPDKRVERHEELRCPCRADCSAPAGDDPIEVHLKARFSGASVAGLNWGKSLLVLVAWMLITGSAGADDMLAAEPLQMAENPDDPGTLVAMAVKYEHAEGVARDYSVALELYCRAARSGNAEAQFALGWMYANGRGVERDDGVAWQLFAMADQQGHPYAGEMMRYTRPDPDAALPDCLRPEAPALQSPAEASATVAAQPSGEVAGTAGQEFQRGPIYDLVHKLAPRYEIDPGLVLAIISVESGFNARATSSRNAQGLMQLVPATAERFRVRNVFDPADNIRGGLAYLQWLMAYFRGNVPLVAAAYNAGERAVERYRGIPPYPETRDYVRKITRLYGQAVHPYRPGLVKAPSFLAAPERAGK